MCLCLCLLCEQHQEGFICPQCRSLLPSQHALVAHFNVLHYSSFASSTITSSSDAQQSSSPTTTSSAQANQLAPSEHAPTAGSNHDADSQQDDEWVRASMRQALKRRDSVTSVVVTPAQFTVALQQCLSELDSHHTG